MSDAPPKPTHYEQSAGAIAMLQEIIPAPLWYKDDPRSGALIVRSVAALEALPVLPDAPKGEDKVALEKWAGAIYEFEWTDKQKDAVKVCVTHFKKQGAFRVSKHTVGLLKLLGLDDE